MQMNVYISANTRSASSVTEDQLSVPTFAFQLPPIHSQCIYQGLPNPDGRSVRIPCPPWNHHFCYTSNQYLIFCMGSPEDDLGSSQIALFYCSRMDLRI